jgi:hypothetical protein
MAMDKLPGLSDGMISPAIWVVNAAASRNMPAASLTLNPAHGAVDGAIFFQHEFDEIVCTFFKQRGRF